MSKAQVTQNTERVDTRCYDLLVAADVNPLPRISVIMPVRNAAGTLVEAYESVRLQTCPEWELVAVDDGSTDETAALLGKLSLADARVRIYSQEGQGICVALQSGCDKARGQLIARMDADDVMSPERLSRQADLLEQHPEIGVVSSLVRHGGDQKEQAGYAEHVRWINTLRTPAEIALRRFVESPVAHPSVMFRRELIERHGGYCRGNFPEDYELWLRWMEAGVQFGKVDAELLTWNDLPGRLSRTESRYSTDAFYRVKCAYLARWIRRHVQASREIWLWGAGRITRRRFCALEAEGTPIAGFIDIDERKLGRLRDGRPVAGPGDLPPKNRAFILAGVASRGARDLIAAELNRMGRVEGEDYLLAA